MGMFNSLVSDSPQSKTESVPEVKGTLAMDNGKITLTFDAADLDPAKLRRSYTGKDGKSHTGTAFKLFAGGLIDDVWVEIATGGFKSVCTVRAMKAK